VIFPSGEITVSRFFRDDDKNLVILPNFYDRLICHVEDSISCPDTEGAFADLTKPANGDAIRKALPDSCLFDDVSSFLVCLASLLSKQWNEEDGPLLTNEKANIFLVRSKSDICYSVRARRINNQWRLPVHFTFESLTWQAGRRVFFRT